MGAKSHYLPLLLLSLSFIFVFSLYNSSISLSSTQSTDSLSSPSLQNPNPTPKFSFTIKLLAYNRLASLSRCLRSLSVADYGGDAVHLHIFIDHFKEGSDSVERKINDSRRILEFVDRFSWSYGEKLVHYRTVNVGLQAQWLEAWWPSSEDEFVFVVEDDLEVSPLYYKFLKSLIVNYYYNESNFSPSIYGASLQRPRFVPGKHGNKMHLDSGTRLFLYQLVGTWGQLLFPRPWKEFRLWYDSHKAQGIKPFLDGMVTTGWYKKMGEKIWTPWFIKFIQSRGYFNIYTNFLNERALSISHRDAGVNYGKTAGPDSSLLTQSSLDFNLSEFHPLSGLKWYDFCFREVLPGRVVRKLDEIRPILHLLQQQKPVLLISLLKASEAVLRNMLCQFERLNVQNYIFMGSKAKLDLVLDLARRGHPVIDTDRVFDSIVRVTKSRKELSKEKVVKAYVVKSCLESGFDTWVTDGNMLVTSTDLFDSIDHSLDFFAGKVSGFFFARSSSSSQKSWDENFVQSFAADVDSLASQDATSFTSAVTKFFGKHEVRIKVLEDKSFSVNLDTLNVNQSSLGNMQKMIFWEPKMESASIQKQLVELGMWLIDGDYSCTAVVCHQQ